MRLVVEMNGCARSHLDLARFQRAERRISVVSPPSVGPEGFSRSLPSGPTIIGGLNCPIGLEATAASLGRDRAHAGCGGDCRKSIGCIQEPCRRRETVHAAAGGTSGGWSESCILVHAYQSSAERLRDGCTSRVPRANHPGAPQAFERLRTGKPRAVTEGMAVARWRGIATRTRTHTRTRGAGEDRGDRAIADPRAFKRCSRGSRKQSPAAVGRGCLAATRWPHTRAYAHAHTGGWGEAETMLPLLTPSLSRISEPRDRARMAA